MPGIQCQHASGDQRHSNSEEYCPNPIYEKDCQDSCNCRQQSRCPHTEPSDGLNGEQTVCKQTATIVSKGLQVEHRPTNPMLIATSLKKAICIPGVGSLINVKAGRHLIQIPQPENGRSSQDQHQEVPLQPVRGRWNQ